jgi:ATPase subunit of ABC transporter with duplicated ATPase domains
MSKSLARRENLLRYPWQISEDYDALVTKIVGLSADVLHRWERLRENEPQAPPPEASLVSRADKIWRNAFPGRQIDINWRVRVTSKLSSSKAAYDAQQMSDGERTAFYLILAALNAAPGPVVVDEPTTHLHPELARLLWNAIEL